MTPPTSAGVGYSGTPLIRKLGLQPPLKYFVVNGPAEFPAWLGPLPNGVERVVEQPEPLVAAHLFTTKKAELNRHLKNWRTRLTPTGFIWISWPKKAAKILSEGDENLIRELALPLGFVDVKVCEVSETWSGLKLVIRKAERES